MDATAIVSVEARGRAQLKQFIVYSATYDIRHISTAADLNEEEELVKKRVSKLTMSRETLVLLDRRAFTIPRGMGATAIFVCTYDGTCGSCNIQTCHSSVC